MLLRSLICKYYSRRYYKRCQVIFSVTYTMCKPGVNLENTFQRSFYHSSTRSFINPGFFVKLGQILNARTSVGQSASVSKINSKFIGTSSYMAKKSKQDAENDKNNEKKDVKDLLETDSELRSILSDIMKDFEGPPPPPSPGTSGKLPTKEHMEDSSVTTKVVASTQVNNPDNLFPNSAKKIHENYSHEMPLSVKDKFREYNESEAEVILAAEEEQQAEYALEESEEEEQEFYLYQEKDNVIELPLERGKTGVFDLPELVDILKSENLKDIAVIEVPKNLHYTDYLVLGTARAPRHARGVSEFIRKLYKKKKGNKDPYIVIEGADCQNWKVLDMGNIVLHIFLGEVRSTYQLEMLWTVGNEYDDLVHQKIDPVSDLLQQHMQFVRDVQPAQEEPENGGVESMIRQT